MEYFVLSSGLNIVQVLPQSNKNLGSSQGYQINLTFQKYFGYEYNRPTSSVEFGLSYESKNYNILNSKNDEIELEPSYLTIPIKYQYEIVDLIKDNLPLSILMGGFYSLLLNEESSDENIAYLSSSNYGIILGSKIDYFFNNGLYAFIEYNLQYGFASLQNSISNSGNISHIINIGFKVPPLF